MPVLGHAFVGLAIGISTRPVPSSEPQAPGRERASVLWLPVAVTLSYLPDIVSQIGLSAGWDDARLLGHSVPFGVAASLGVAPALMRLADVSFGRALLTALLSMLLHDALDLLQATDRVPWWPFSRRHRGSDLGLIPVSFLSEAGLFGAGLLAFLGLRRVASRAARRSVAPRRASGQRNAHWVWAGRALVGAIVLAAALTHWLRESRESQLEAGRALVEQRAYQTGLQALDRAEPWPSTARPGRIDYLRAEAYAGMGDRARAETHYLRAYRADPSYFWVVADLAVFYASSDGPAEERRQRAEPYLSRLRSDFAGHSALPQALARVERRLGVAAPGRTSAPGETSAGMPMPGETLSRPPTPVP